MITPLGAALALLIGVALGLLGGGGSILTVPALVYVLGVPPKAAIAMSLLVVGITSLVGSVLHWRQGAVQLRVAGTVGVFAMVGAWVGARLASALSGTAQLLLLAVVMLAAAISMLRDRRESATATSATHPAVLAAVAIGVGVLTGLVGIGGGFLVVPALVLLAGMPMREAVGTSLLVITMNAVAGFVGHLETQAIDWPLLAAFTGCTVLGTIAGTAVAPRVPQRTLRRSFGLLLVVLGIFMLYQNRQVIPGMLPATGR